MNCQPITTELDLSPSSKPDMVNTRWHVLTGAACTGKTTLIRKLADMGYLTIPESARLYFESEIAKGKTLEEIRADGARLQRGIAARQLSLEDKYPSDETVFLDRAIPDSLTFYRLHGMDPNEILPQCFWRRYATVFILDRLDIARDEPLGPEDHAASSFLDEWLVRDYMALGYAVIRVPPLRPEERLSFVLERLSQ